MLCICNCGEQVREEDQEKETEEALAARARAKAMRSKEVPSVARPLPSLPDNPAPPPALCTLTGSCAVLIDRGVCAVCSYIYIA